MQSISSLNFVELMRPQLILKMKSQKLLKPAATTTASKSWIVHKIIINNSSRENTGRHQVMMADFGISLDTNVGIACMFPRDFVIRTEKGLQHDPNDANEKTKLTLNELCTLKIQYKNSHNQIGNWIKWSEVTCARIRMNYHYFVCRETNR